MTVGYSTATHASRSKVKRWSHGSRFKAALSTVAIQSGSKILDYGAGDGHLLKAIADGSDAGELWAFEPRHADAARLSLAAEKNARVVTKTQELPNNYFDIIFCMEVLEHLREDLRREALSEMIRSASPDAIFVISVPIEIGLTAIFKNAGRYAAGERHTGSLGSIIKSAMGDVSGVKRDERGNYISSHIGFDYRSLRAIFKEFGLVIRGISYSPMPVFRGVLNSQITYRLSRRIA